MRNLLNILPIKGIQNSVNGYDVPEVYLQVR